MLMQSDLKLSEWLSSALIGDDTNTVSYVSFTPKDTDVLTHKVRFDVVTGGELTPTWKLIRATVNPSGTFLSAHRDRSHQLTLTIGPTEVATVGPAKGKRIPTRAAADSALASEIGVAVANSVRRVLR
jgi:hypothetical protein